jgi:hypothetical protein
MSWRNASVGILHECVFLNSEEGLHVPFDLHVVETLLKIIIVVLISLASVVGYLNLWNEIIMEGVMAKDIWLGRGDPQVQRNLLNQILFVNGRLAEEGLGRETALHILLKSALEDLAGTWVMVIVVIDEGLEVSYFDLLLSIFTLYKRVQLEFLGVVLASVGFHQLLDDLVALEVGWGEAKDVVGLLLGDEPAFDSQTLLCDLLSAFVAELFHAALQSLSLQVLHDLLHTLVHGERPDLSFEAVGRGSTSKCFVVSLFTD